MYTPTALSLFSGCGGDTLGMTNAGIDVVAYSELKTKFQETHELNFKNSKLIGGDINKINGRTILYQCPPIFHKDEKPINFQITNNYI